MDADALREHLEKLHQELSAAQRVDPRSAQVMGDVLRDIQRLLEPGAAGAAGAAPGSPANASLPDRLETLAVQFEAQHPTLAASSRRLVDLLGSVGL